MTVGEWQNNICAEHIFYNVWRLNKKTNNILSLNLFDVVGIFTIFSQSDVYDEKLIKQIFDQFFLFSSIFIAHSQ